MAQNFTPNPNASYQPNYQPAKGPAVYVSPSGQKLNGQSVNVTPASQQTTTASYYNPNALSSQQPNVSTPQGATYVAPPTLQSQNKISEANQNVINQIQMGNPNYNSVVYSPSDLQSRNVGGNGRNYNSDNVALAYSEINRYKNQPQTFTEKLNVQTKEFEQGYKEQASKGNYGGVILGASLAVGAGFTEGFIQTPIGLYKAATHPIKTAQNVRGFIANPNPVISAGIKEFKLNPAGTIGNIAGSIAFGEGAAKVIDIGGGAYVKSVTKEIPIEKVFAPEVLEGKSTFPMSKNVAQTIKEFQATKTPEGYLVGTHTTDININLKTIGKAGQKFEQDTGLFITPASKGSPRFLGLEPVNYLEATKSFFKNPIEALKNTKIGSVNPTVVNIEFKSIERLPENIIQSKGFTEVKAFEISQSKTGSAFVTARSERGLRGINSLGKTTGELEAIIPEGTKVIKVMPEKATFQQKLLGFTTYTKYEGKIVPIKQFRTVSTEDYSLAVKSSTKELSKSIESNNELMYGTKYVSPYKISGSISSVAVSSSKPSSSKSLSYVSESIPNISKSMNQSYSKSVSKPSYSFDYSKYSSSLSNNSYSGKSSYSSVSLPSSLSNNSYSGKSSYSSVSLPSSLLPPSNINPFNQDQNGKLIMFGNRRGGRRVTAKIPTYDAIVKNIVSKSTTLKPSKNPFVTVAVPRGYDFTKVKLNIKSYKGAS